MQQPVGKSYTLVEVVFFIFDDLIKTVIKQRIYSRNLSLV